MRQLLFLLLVPVLSCNQSDSNSAKSDTNVIGCFVPPTHDKAWYSSGKKAPLFEGLEGVGFAVSSNHPEVQRYFNQGLMWAYGFNHAEAARSFYEATRLDSNCAMAFWGYAYVLGPNYNAGMEEDNFQRAYDAAVRAKKLIGQCTPKEAALVEALSSRYAAEPPADRSPLDIAYSAAMKKVYDQYPNDPDIGALYAESLMNLHPWDLYDKVTHEPRSWTPELLAVLQQLIKKNPTHPGAHHFYIHAMETSASPETALASAYLLDTLVQGAGHLLHMPSHIYINTGDYHLGTISNLKAVEVDSLYTTTCHAQGAYPLAYYPHNYHFLVATATLEGNSKIAWEASQQLHQHTSQEIMRQPGWGTLQHYYTIPYYVAVKLSMWDTILSMPSPTADLVYPLAVWHYARGMAFLGKHDLAAARKELLKLQAYAADTSLKDLTVWAINSTADLAQIALKVLSGAVAWQDKDVDAAVRNLGEAVALEDLLNYNEPPDWFFSVRHHLGAVLAAAGRHSDAERVFRDDLKIWKKNGWALIGLADALAKQGKAAEASVAKADFEKAWQYADFKIRSSSSIVE